jgi:deazaflavin-dependent oxidoreductase (nitroreductase family)
MGELQDRNRALVLEPFDVLFNQRDRVAAERYWSPGYLQHSANLPPGRDGLFEAMRAAPPQRRYELGLAVAEGDYVVLHGRITGRGDAPNLIAADILRVHEGMLVEHWDVLQEEATCAGSRSGLPMFGETFAAERPGAPGTTVEVAAGPANDAAAAVYVPSPRERERLQVALHEATDGAVGDTLNGRPVIILTHTGARSGLTRKTPLMRVEQVGSYAVIASNGGARTTPQWALNIAANPSVHVQDGPVKSPTPSREALGDEKERWWARAVEVYEKFAEYRRATGRTIPVYVLEPV